MNKAPFVINPHLTAIAIAVRNQAFIADQVLPYTPVNSAAFKYTKYTQEEGFTIPNTQVGRKGRPNQVEFTSTEAESSVIDYGLEDVVPQGDIENAATNPAADPLGDAVEGIMDLVLLGREKRVADLVFAAANYDTGLKTTLSGTDQWSDFTNSDPIDDITAALDAMIVPANTMVLGQATFTKLRMHPKIAKAFNGNSGDTAIVARRAIAELFELENVLVGRGWYNSAAKGQAASYGRIWGKHCALLHIDPKASTQKGVTFGLTARHGDRIAGTYHDDSVGLRGAEVAKAGESVKELITHSGAGYLFTNAVA